MILTTSGLPRPFAVLPLFAIGVLLTLYSSGKAQSGSETQVVYINPAELTPATRYSHTAVVNRGRFALISGQIAVDSKGQLVGRGDFRKQAEQVFGNLRAALKSAGGDTSDIVNLTTYYVNLSDLPIYREVRQAFLASRKGPPPTSTTVQVAGLVMEGALLEVSAIAILPPLTRATVASMPVSTVAVLHAKPGRVEALEKELMANAVKARSETECLEYEIHRALDDPSVFFLYERWNSKEGLDRHLDMPYMKAWAARRDDLVERHERSIGRRTD